MAAVTICSDFEAPKNKVWHCFHCHCLGAKLSPTLCDLIDCSPDSPGLRYLPEFAQTHVHLVESSQGECLQTSAVCYDSKDSECPSLLLRLLWESREQRAGALQVEVVVLRTGGCSLDCVLSNTDTKAGRAGAWAHCHQGRSLWWVSVQRWMQLPAHTLPSTPASGLSVPLDSTSLESLACFQCPLYPLFPHKDARPSGPHLKIPPASAILIHIHPFLCFLFPPFIACYTFGKSGKSSNRNKTFVKGLPRLMLEWKDFFLFFRNQQCQEKDLWWLKFYLF